MLIKAPLPLVLWCLSSHLPLVCRLVVASPVVVRLRLASLFVVQPPQASIFDSPLIVLTSWLLHHKYLHRLRLLTRRCLATGCVVVINFDLRQIVIVVVSHHTIAIVVNFVACCVAAIVMVMLFLEMHVCAFAR
jgi:hypothetical protein